MTPPLRQQRKTPNNMKRGVAGGIVIGLMVAFSLQAQMQGRDVTAEKIFYKADFLTLYDKWEEALPLYLQLEREDSLNGNLHYLIGRCYLHIAGLHGEAIPWLEKATHNISRRYQKELYEERHAPRESWLLLGRACQAAGDLDRAEEAYLKYRKMLKRKEDHREVDRLLKSVTLAREMLKEDPDIEIVEPELLKVGEVNYHPAVSGNGQVMVFMSDTRYYHAIYFTRREGGAWTIPRNITMDVQSDGTYRVASLNYDGDLLFLTVPGRDNYNIYSSRWDSTARRWGKATPLPGRVNTLKNEIFASLSPDGQTLYFVSDRSGGEGGYDIFTARKNKEGEWSEIIPLGPPVNTPGNERSPILADGGKKLFFSSDRHATMGGYDIFVSSKERKNWSPPRNIGHPPNTSDDNLFFVPVEEGYLGYFTQYSVKAPKRATITTVEFFSALHPRPVAVTGRLRTADGTPLPPGVEAIVTRTTTGEQVATVVADESGRFRLQLPAGEYRLVLRGKGIETSSQNVALPPGEKKYELNLNVKRLPAAEKEKRIYRIRPVYFAFDSYALTATARATLDSLAAILDTLQEVKIVIEGHTDAWGSDAYNMRLSLRRAEAVRKYLMRKGISSDRMTVKGYGERRPVALNTNADGTDNPRGRAYNRRATYLFQGADATGIIVVQDVPPTLRYKK